MRRPEIVVLSDIHLGTYGCHADELLDYLKSIQPNILILNGDIIDGWQFKKNYFPANHYAVIQKFIKFLKQGTKIYYLTGNHDDFLRRISGLQIADFSIKEHLNLTIDGKKHWFFHGDVFDSSVTISPWIAKLGGKGYDLLIRVNRIINRTLAKMNKPPMSFSKKIKSSVKNAVKFISDFEQTAIDMAVHEKNDVVVCGHIHQPIIRKEEVNGRSILYLNSGDWVENLTALEYENGEWKLYDYFESIEITSDELMEVK
ncbi:UDP-2,3-diacylglucosamine diphosphatase [Portibacter lacus]|uniref:UDP-2,3-diacylglucosamine hydrolase n=1 Tax=Portibacter lacus TaxID=1099794 RepID=A0AA37SLG0_9BACT|nr:UDP-2,3-diacylglucosamine diphosphatase [Portibacter lacus]GLR16262.1 UDP-2,3-diacylglucosamine hydrolase [Portibacter lacus]